MYYYYKFTECITNTRQNDNQTETKRNVQTSIDYDTQGNEIEIYELIL